MSEPARPAPTPVAIPFPRRPEAAVCLCCGGTTDAPAAAGWVTARRPAPAAVAFGVCPGCADAQFGHAAAG